MVFLSNLDLLEAARKYKINLGGVYSKDKIPLKLQTNKGYIINLENSVDSKGGQLPGSHWVAFWLDSPRNKKHIKTEAFYMDPFGFQPPIEVEKILSRYGPYYMNSTQIQSMSSGICGYYCIYFIYYMQRYSRTIPDSRRRFQKFVDEFNENHPSKNRQILEDELKRHFPRH